MTATKTAKSAKASPAVNGNGAAKGLKKLVKQLAVPVGAEHIRLTTYTAQDGALPIPVVQFGQVDDRWAFSFGAGKAKRLLAAVDEVGADVVIHTLRTLVARGVNGNGHA